MNQYKERIKRLRGDYNAAVWASSPFYDEQEDYRSWELDYEAHADACAEIVTDAYRKGDYAHMWEALNEAYMTAEVFVAIGYIAGVECVFGRACWLKTRRTGRLPRAPLTFLT